MGCLCRCNEANEQLYFRIRLDRRRFEAAHLKYALLMTQRRYATIPATQIPMQTEFNETLKTFTPLFYEAFTQKYSGMYVNMYVSVFLYPCKFSTVYVLKPFRPQVHVSRM